MKNSPYLHVIIWTVFIVYEISTIYFVVGQVSGVLDYASHYFLNILLFYTHAVVFVKSNKKSLFFAFILVELSVYLSFNYAINFLLTLNMQALSRPITPLRPFFVASFWRFTYFVGLGSLYASILNFINSQSYLHEILIRQFNSEKKIALIEKDLLVTKNSLLRSQINPHLFFNTLNFIYERVYRISEDAGEAVMLLSDITRYSISTAENSELVFVSDELKNIDNLIALNRVRFGDHLKIVYNVSGDFSNAKIIPLILLTMVENIFKHGDLNEPALISISIDNELFRYESQNKKRQRSTDTLSNTGLGLSNSRLRLDYEYNNNYSLDATETGDSFFVKLTIDSSLLC